MAKIQPWEKVQDVCLDPDRGCWGVDWRQDINNLRMSLTLEANSKVLTHCHAKRNWQKVYYQKHSEKNVTCPTCKAKGRPKSLEGYGK
jgi:hypothetical protein